MTTSSVHHLTSMDRAGIYALLLTIAVGVLVCWLERPRFPRNRRIPRGVSKPLPPPWDGAVIRNRRYYVQRWSAAVGKAYRTHTPI